MRGIKFDERKLFQGSISDAKYQKEVTSTHVGLIYKIITKIH